MLNTTTKKPFGYLFSKEYQEIKRLKTALAVETAKLKRLEAEAATKGAK